MPPWLHRGISRPPDFNGPFDVPFTPFREEWLDLPIFERFKQVAQAHATQVTLSGPLHTLTFEQALQRSQRLAERIAAQGQAGKPVGIMLAQDLSFPVAALACLAASRPFIPVDLKYPPARIAAVIEDAGASLVITCRGAAETLIPAGVQAVFISEDAQMEVDGVAPAALPPPLAVDAPAIILYTSGSSGRPKGICNNQRALLQRVAEATNSSHLNPDDRMVLLSSPGTIAGEREMFAALLNGARLSLCDPQRDGLHGVLRWMASEKASVCYIVPALLRMLLRAPGASQALAALRVLRIGGDITLASDLQLFRQVAPANCHFLASFSATEMPAVFQWFVPRDWQPDGPRVPVGYARPEVEIALQEEDGSPADGAEFAELVVKSRYLALGLWQEGRLQPGPIRQDPADPQERILACGDLLRARADGLWELAGRRDRQLKIRGQRIDSGELEAVLRGHMQVDDVAVLARRQGDEAVALVAFFASEQGPTGLADELRALMAQKLPQYMQPAQLYRLPAIPQLPGFKPDMVRLQKMDQELQAAMLDERNARNQPVPPLPQPFALDASHQRVGTAVRAAVKSAWTRVLGADGYRLDLPFDECGGDSLKALELWFHIEEELGFKLGLDAMGLGARPSLLEQSLEHAILQPRNLAASSPSPDTPLIWLAPGILGDDPMQLRFRNAFGSSVRFKLIDYPGWRDTMENDCSFDAIVDAAFAQVMAEGPQEVYRVAGYSYGGIVAFELARKLVDAGCKVDMVTLLDSRRWDVADTQPIWQKDAMLPETGLVARVLATSITGLVRLRMYRVLSLACGWLLRHSSRLAFRFRNRMTKDLRFMALRKWRARYLPAPMTLFVSSTRWPGEPQGYGWQDLSDSLDVVYVGGTHASMIDKPGRETIAEHIQRALSESCGRVTVT
jgi:acyl-coenzyme A synthetase/AMP-(fatty) acid ligase/thioesterase domain-containing protein